MCAITYSTIFSPAVYFPTSSCRQICSHLGGSSACQCLPDEFTEEVVHLSPLLFYSLLPVGEGEQTHTHRRTDTHTHTQTRWIQFRHTYTQAIRWGCRQKHTHFYVALLSLLTSFLLCFCSFFSSHNSYSCLSTIHTHRLYGMSLRLITVAWGF